MKTLYVLLTFLSSSIILNAQQFSTQFYFTDTLGNQDTVTVGFDPAATRGVDADFGEVDIRNIPFSNTLDVRTAQFGEGALSCEPNNGPFSQNIDDDNELMLNSGKKDIVGGVCDMGDLKLGLFLNTTAFIFKNNALPVRISWDSLVYEEACFKKSILTDWLPSLWFDSSCDGIIIFNDTLDRDQDLWVNIPTPLQMIDRFGDTLSIVHFAFRDNLISSIEKVALPTFQTFPNPAQNQLTIQLPDTKNRSWQLLNLHGAIVRKGTFHTAVEQIDLQEITNGIYFLQITGFKAKRIVVGRS